MIVKVTFLSGDTYYSLFTNQILKENDKFIVTYTPSKLLKYIADESIKKTILDIEDINYPNALPEIDLMKITDTYLSTIVDYPYRYEQNCLQILVMDRVLNQFGINCKSIKNNLVRLLLRDVELFKQDYLDILNEITNSLQYIESNLKKL